MGLPSIGELSVNGPFGQGVEPGGFFLNVGEVDDLGGDGDGGLLAGKVGAGNRYLFGQLGLDGDGHGVDLCMGGSVVQLKQASAERMSSYMNSTAVHIV